MRTTYFKPVIDMTATGRKIKTLMGQRGISARELQAIMGFPYVQTIYNWFTGKNMPIIDNLVVTKVWGVDDIQALLNSTGLTCRTEHSLPPRKMVDELPDFDRLVFSLLYTGSFYRKIYRLYEIESRGS